VPAPGSIVYWTTSGGSSFKGFTIGDEGVKTILQPPGAATACVGCHSSTPDGKFVGLSASDNAGNGDPARIELRSVDGKATQPAFLSSAAKTLLARTYQEQPVFSRAHWQDGDHVVLSMMPINMRSEILWTDLEATSTVEGSGWGVIARTGDAGQAASVHFSHDGQRLVYGSASMVGAGVTTPDGDLYTVPYSNRKGGAATKLAGASDPAHNEYYPSFSPDDRFVTFTRVASGQSSYNNKAAEIFIVPATGGAATRLLANDPPACSSVKSPGVTNSWPKWAPSAGTSGGRVYYWLTFSSVRADGTRPQLYVTAVTIEGEQVITHGALYLWNQPEGEANHTPAWDDFELPIG